MARQPLPISCLLMSGGHTLNKVKVPVLFLADGYKWIRESEVLLTQAQGIYFIEGGIRNGYDSTHDNAAG